MTTPFPNTVANVANVAKRHFAALLSIKPHFATHCQSTQKVRQNFAAPFAALCQYETSLPRFFAALFSIYSKTIDWEGFKKKNTSALYCTLCGKLPWKPHHKYYHHRLRVRLQAGGATAVWCMYCGTS